MKSCRIDHYLLESGLTPSLAKAQALIMSGVVLVDDKCVDKCGQEIALPATVRLKKNETPYVSRGGEKLAGAQNAFGFSCEGRVALDVGVSTGGFTDFLLQSGAAFVFGIDVGYGQLDFRIRQDERVFVLERCNARLLTKPQLAQKLSKNSHLLSYLDHIDLVVMDLSFISVTKVLPVVKTWVDPHSEYVVLIKPQFEAERDWVGEGGIIRDPEVRERVILSVMERLIALGFMIKGRCDSPILGAKGNHEFFLWLAYGG